MRPPLAAGIVASIALGMVPALVGCGGAGRTAEVRSPTLARSATASAGAAATGGSAIPAPSPGSTTPASTAPQGAAVSPQSPTPRTTATPRPAIHSWPIPYGAARRQEMAAYSRRHYGEDSYVLSNPKVIVEHYTETATATAAYNTFAADMPDSEFHELPNTCAHFLVEPSGRIDQLVSLSVRCRHTTGLNWTAIGIENVGYSDQAILERPAQLAASLRLTRWLRCRYGIAMRNVIGHNESLSSPYHHDRVPAFQHQTHSDWNHADMTRYRSLLARLPCL
ncbi:MAG TPA: peptidoglycan recognition family protein [Solirubrobacteraceae bacterium]|nr:peptidoglycan recognition family protein [Solirubrobacteraceae bacterium]